MNEQLPDEQTFRTGEPDLVYHYTSMEVLQKIAESTRRINEAQTGILHATNLNYLNDTSEGDYLLRLVRDRIPIFIKERNVKDTSPFEAFLEDRWSIGRVLTGRPFAASFSEEPDSLPQWRSYCAAGNGVSIGFMTECLKRTFVPSLDTNDFPAWEISPPAVSFDKIRYLDVVDTSSVDQMIASALSEAESMAGISHTIDPETAIKEDVAFNLEITRSAAFVKDKSFSRECEYRLLADPVYMAYRYLRFRPSRSTLIPFIELHVPTKTKKRSFIGKIVIGPTPNVALSIEAVRAMMYSLGLQPDVIPSSIPFREL